jgi:hypothetical protein
VETVAAPFPILRAKASLAQHSEGLCIDPQACCEALGTIKAVAAAEGMDIGGNSCPFIELGTIMANVESWSQFDVFKTLDLTHGQPLVCVGFSLWLRSPLLAPLHESIGTDAVVSFLRHAEATYKETPYHSACHAADALQAAYCLLSAPGIAEHVTPVEALSVFIAMAIHDAGHPGTNNAWQVASSTELALRYNDRSVLENMHASRGWTECIISSGLLDALSQEERAAFRKLTLQLVLATDVSVHHEHISRLKTKMHATSTGIDLRAAEDRLLALIVIVKSADISNGARPRLLALRWTELSVAEFWRQGDAERAQQLPVSSYCDRRHPNVPGSQVGFLRFLVMDGFTLLSELSPALDVPLKHLKDNLVFWEKQQAQRATPRSSRSSRSYGSLEPSTLEPASYTAHGAVREAAGFEAYHEPMEEVISRMFREAQVSRSVLQRAESLTDLSAPPSAPLTPSVIALA